MIQVKNLSKKFKKNESYSLKDVNFSVDVGEIVGLIGKNGAGKTTLMKLIAKAIKPTDGDIFIHNKSILKKNNSLKEVGFMIEGSIFNHLSAVEHLKFFIKLNGDKKDYNNIEEVLKLVDLWEKKDKNPNSFSFGMKQRLSLAICLVTQPKLLILDEPFVGLDPNGVDKLIQTLKKWVEQKDTAIIISSHQLSELEEICTRYLFIDNGLLKEDFDSEKENTTLIELEKEFNYKESFKEKYGNYINVTNNKKIIEVNNEDGILSDLLADLTKEYKILSIKEKKDLIQQKFKGDNNYE
ncbi:ABC transporter ATP-binding protein [Staphylococcus pasteuri]|jgi:ABC-2 type transport system ATP-binding protein|uniref:ABC transporter ATP-binding protein n=1 Tax=Staphylococcus pasteuri TaxID=45972 RepID=UPI000E680EA2|nr:ABC transporter ATP-binding protein [Staphylococcus pasteuri]RIO54568.1 ABC transporter ATP-binding protein [Staphylococcus pasteuri]